MGFRLQKIFLCFTAIATVGIFTLAYFVVFRGEPWTPTPPAVITDIYPTGAQPIPLVNLSDEVWAQIPVFDFTPSSRSFIQPFSAGDGGSTYGYNWLVANKGSGSVECRVYNAIKSMAIVANSTTAGNYNEFTEDVYHSNGTDTAYYSVGQMKTSDVGISVGLDDLWQLVSDPNNSDIVVKLQLAVNTFEQDNPQYFSGMVGFGLKPNYNPFDLYATVTPLFPAQYRLCADREAAQAKADAKFAEYKALADTVGNIAEKVRLVHDKIVTERDYAYINGTNTPSNKVVAHNIMGVMDPGNFEAELNPVCESYAKANAYILTRLGIECWTVFGDTNTNPADRGYHAWNIIKIGEFWYYHDVTWDDNENTNGDQNNIYNDFDYNWFLKGSNEWSRHYPNTSNIDSSSTTSYGVGMPGNFSQKDYGDLGNSYVWNKIPPHTPLTAAYCSNENLTAYIPTVEIPDLTQGADFKVVQLNTPTNDEQPSRFLVYGRGNNRYRGVGLVTQTLTDETAEPEIPRDLTATYGQTLSAVELPEGWVWHYPTDSVGGSGTQTHLADFSRYGWTDKFVQLSVTVNKAMPLVTAPSGLTANIWQILGEIILPDGWAWETPTVMAGIFGFGDNVHRAVFTPLDTANYNTVTANVTVTVETIDPAPPQGLTAAEGQTLAEIELDGGWYWVNETDAVGAVGEQKHLADFHDVHGYTDTYGVELSVTVTAAEPPTEPTDPIDPDDGDGGEEEPTDPPADPPTEPTEPTEPNETTDIIQTPPDSKPDAETVALAVTGVFCLGLIGFVARKFLFKK